jgi:hypothetical protein
MGKKFDWTPEALSGALGVAIEICILSVMPATRVVLDRLCLAVCFGLDVLIKLIVFRELP